MQKKEIDFISPCPVVNCPNSKSPYVWTHHECGGKEKIDSFGYIRCCKCGEKGQIVDWNFDCTHHEYKANSSIGKYSALFVCSMISDKDFVSSILIEITKQLANQPSSNEQQEKPQQQQQQQQQQPTPNKVDDSLPSILREDTSQPSEKEQFEQIELICACPCKECRKKQNNNEITWKHKSCKGSLYLDEKCIVNCEQCGTKSKLTSFMFDCKTQHAMEEFESVNYDIGTYLSMFSQIKALQTKNLFLSKLMTTIFTQINSS
jgi:hypothetical protein